jgi:hypothetical protein
MIAQPWLGAGEGVDLVGLAFEGPRRATAALLVTGTSRGGVALGAIAHLVFERGDWKVDNLSFGPVRTHDPSTGLASAGLPPRVDGVSEPPRLKFPSP